MSSDHEEEESSTRTPPSHDGVKSILRLSPDTLSLTLSYLGYSDFQTLMCVSPECNDCAKNALARIRTLDCKLFFGATPVEKHWDFLCTYCTGLVRARLPYLRVSKDLGLKLVGGCKHLTDTGMLQWNLEALHHLQSSGMSDISLAILHLKFRETARRPRCFGFSIQRRSKDCPHVELLLPDLSKLLQNLRVFSFTTTQTTRRGFLYFLRGGGFQRTSVRNVRILSLNCSLAGCTQTDYKQLFKEFVHLRGIVLLGGSVSRIMCDYRLPAVTKAFLLPKSVCESLEFLEVRVRRGNDNDDIEFLREHLHRFSNLRELYLHCESDGRSRRGPSNVGDTLKEIYGAIAAARFSYLLATCGASANDNNCTGELEEVTVDIRSELLSKRPGLEVEVGVRQRLRRRWCSVLVAKWTQRYDWAK